MPRTDPPASRDTCDTTAAPRPSVTSVTPSGRIVVDIETDGLDATQVLCIGVLDLESGDGHVYGPDELDAGLHVVEHAAEIWTHNGLGFDLPVLRRLHGIEPKGRVRDTLVLARLHRPDMPGGHSLQAWGKRISVEKGDMTCVPISADEGSWAASWSPAMAAYCLQDCRVTAALRTHLLALKLPEQAVDLEHRFAQLMHLQEQRGFMLDCDAARKLAADLGKRLSELDEAACKQFMRPGLSAELSADTFNPASRQQVAERLLEHGWVPAQHTPTGRPVVNEGTLRSADVAGANLLAEAFQIRKHLGMLADGSAAWLRLVRGDGRLHGRVNPCGTVSWRCTHASPNLAQVPAENCFRRLFIPQPGWKLVGCDAKSLELRVLAHYLQPFDGGAFIERVTKGDVHQQTQQSLGLANRAHAKRLMFALIYGAGDARLGEIVGGTHTDGVELRQAFMQRTPGFAQLLGWVRAQSAKGWLEGLNGCALTVRSRHSALNLLIQSAGAVVMKQALVTAVELLTDDRLDYWRDYALVAHVHDEIQVEARPEVCWRVARCLESAVRIAGEQWDLRCPMAATSRIGDTWSETH